MNFFDHLNLSSFSIKISSPSLFPFPFVAHQPWFYCDLCGDTIKKPKVAQHCGQCRGASFTCIDCSRPFTQQTVQGHTSCVTEHEKYAQGATKPGGFASKGFFGDAAAAAQNGEHSGAGGVEGVEILSRRAPWKCSICNVTCTSSDTLMGHAGGTKHKRRSKAAIAARAGGGAEAEAATTTTTTTQQEGNDDVKKEEEKVEEDEVLPAATSDGEKTASKSKKTKKEIETETENEKKKKKKVKWTALAVDELKRSGGEMKAKKLVKALLAAAGSSTSEDSDAVLKKLEKSSRFTFGGKTVTLTS